MLFTSSTTWQLRKARLSGLKTAFGPMGGIPPTDRSSEVDYVHSAPFRDGKHVSFDPMFDRLTMLEPVSNPAVAR
jgi:hypothetical protein